MHQDEDQEVVEQVYAIKRAVDEQEDPQPIEYEPYEL